MPKPDFIALVIKVATSWQVIFITIALAIYSRLVSYVARLYHKPKASSSASKPKKQKAEPVPQAEITGGGGDEELGLEEE